MTTGFKIKDKVLLAKVEPGDKVELTIVQAGKDYVITSRKQLVRPTNSIKSRSMLAPAEML